MSTKTDLNTDLSAGLRFGAWVSAALVAIFGLWAGFTTISGAVIAPGAVVVDGDPRQIQHLDGGIVAEIAVRDGDLVKAGDVLVSLDPTVLKTTHDMSRRRLADALARMARLEAELADADSIAMPPRDPALADLDLSAEMAMQTDLFTARTALRRGQAEALAEALASADSQIASAEAERTALARQVALLEDELARVGDLVQRDLARAGQLTALEQQHAELAGAVARQDARMSELDATRRAARLQAAQDDRAFRESVVGELAQASTEAAELKLDILTRTARLDRVVLRAPVDGVVHELQVQSPGAVIAPGETVLQIVPHGDLPLVEVSVDPRGIDQVHVGQGAEIMLASFDPNATPRLKGIVTRVSADAVQDPATGQSFYRVAVQLPAAELARMGEVAILPGMPVEAYLKTQDRTVLAYLTQPLTRALGRAFREG